MKRLKLSRYNLFLPISDDYVLAFNTVRGAFAMLEGKHYKTIERCQTSGDINTDLPDFLLLDLFHGGFAIDENIDEFRLLKVRSMYSKTAHTSMMMTIVPSMECNLRCTYCYQEPNKKPEVMDKYIQDAIVDNIETRISSPTGPKSVGITWYGGEPLMFWDIVVDLGTRIKQLCAEYNATHHSSMVTNGTLLTPDKVTKLLELGVNDFQITVDGPKEIHDQRRPYGNGRGSFDDIMQNLRALKGRPVKVNIRSNVDRSNVDHTRELVSQISDLSDFCALSLAQTLTFPACGCTYPEEKVYSTTDFADVLLESRKVLRESGFRTAGVPQPRLFVCGADRGNAFLVAADGTLYKCWNDIGVTGRALGHIAHPVPFDTPSMIYYLDWDPFSDPDCSQCSHMPLCMGGCPSKPALGMQTISGHDCGLIRYTLNEDLKNYYLMVNQALVDKGVLQQGGDGQ